MGATTSTSATTTTMKAIDVACFFAKQGEESGRSLTNMDLQKLVYFAHGWHLGLTNGIPLLDEEIQAWKYGPVVPSLYNQLKSFGNEPIPLAKIQKKCENFESISEGDEKFLKAIWQVYKRYSTFSLVQATHAGDTPWDRIKRENSGIVMNAVIPDSYMQEFFSKLLKK